MSLALLAGGYTGETVAFEGVSPEDLARYDEINGPVFMAMETTQLLNQAFMDGIYAPNDMIMEAAMEGYSDVMEAGKIDKIKERLKNAGHAIAETFRKMGRAIRALFSNIGTKIKGKSSEAAETIRKSGVKELNYTGPKYTHLEDIGGILKERTPENVLGKIKTFKDSISGQIKKKGYVFADGFKDEMDQAITDMKKDFDINEGSKLSDSTILAQYWRDGGTGEDTKNNKISSSEAIKILKSGAKIYSDLDQVSKNIQTSYEDYAKKCDELGKKADDEQGVSFTDEMAAWNAIVSASSKCQTFVNTILTTWNTAYSEASSKWVSAANSQKGKE